MSFVVNKNQKTVVFSILLISLVTFNIMPYMFNAENNGKLSSLLTNISDKFNSIEKQEKNMINSELKLLNLSYLIFDFKTMNENGFLAYYNTYDLFNIYRALYRNAKIYGWLDKPLVSFGLLATLAFYTKNKTMAREAEYLWNYIKENLLYTAPISILSNTKLECYRIPYLSKYNRESETANIYSQVVGLYYLWKITGNYSYFEDLRKSIMYKESYIDDGGVNHTYLYGYYYNVIWHPFVNTADPSRYHPPYGSPIFYIYWNGTAISKYNYWTWTSQITTVFNIALKENIITPVIYSKVFRDLFFILWDGSKMIWEAWSPFTNDTRSLFGEGKTRIHAYNLGPFIFSARYFPELNDYLSILFNTMSNYYWLNSRKMYKYNPSNAATFEQFMMTIPNALYQLNNKSDIVINRNVLSSLTYLIAGVLKRPVAWPNKADYYGILHAKYVSGDWLEKDSGSPQYVDVKNTHEGYSTAMYLLSNYRLEQLYFNSYVYSLVNCLTQFIDSNGYFLNRYSLTSGLNSITFLPNIVMLSSYFPMLYNFSYGKTWHDEFRYSYRWSFFPIFFKLRKAHNETEIIFTIMDIHLNKNSLLFLPFYDSISDKLPSFNAKKIIINGEDFTDKTVIFSDNVISLLRKTDYNNFHVSNLTIVYSNKTEYIQDQDQDLLIDYWENITGFDPFEADTDGDGLIDSYEAYYGDFSVDLNDDSDRDRMPIRYEQFFFTSPYKKDTDNDELSDGFEIAFNLDPLDIDTDNDGVKDGDELEWQLNPRTRYTHKSEYPDRSDWYWYSIIENAGSWDKNMEKSYETSLDFDSDGISNYLEFYNGYDIFSPNDFFVGFTYPENNTWINTSEINIKWSYMNNSPFQGFSIRIDNVTHFVGFKTCFIATGLFAGAHTATIYMHISDNLTLAVSIRLYVDFVPPNIEILEPKNNSVIKKNWSYITWICYDDYAGVAEIYARINNGSWMRIGPVDSFNATGLHDGENRIEIKVIDKAGNTKKIVIILYVNLPDNTFENVYLIYLSITICLIVVSIAIIYKEKITDHNKSNSK